MFILTTMIFKADEVFKEFPAESACQPVVYKTSRNIHLDELDFIIENGLEKFQVEI